MLKRFHFAHFVTVSPRQRLAWRPCSQAQAMVVLVLIMAASKALFLRFVLSLRPVFHQLSTVKEAKA